MSIEEIISHMLKISKELPDNNRKALFKAIVTLALRMVNVGAFPEKLRRDFKNSQNKFHERLSF